MALLLSAAFYRPLAAHVRLAMDPSWVNDDARQLVAPFLHYYDPSLFRGDYIQDYYRAATPEGYRALYRLTSAWWDPRAVSKVLPYPLLLALLVVIGVAGHRLGGPVAAWFAMAWVLTAGIFLDRLTGGLPRSFAYPIAAGAAAACVVGRAYWLAAAVLLAAAFYPVIAAIAGPALAVLLLLVPAKDRGDAAGWSLRKRLLVLTATAAAAALLVLPSVLRLQPYGPAIPWTHAKQWPELGSQGRYRPNDRAPFPGLLRAAGDATALSFRPMSSRLDAPGGVAQQARWIAGAALATAGMILLAWKKPEGRRLLALPAAAVAGYVASRLAPPLLYLPQRYLLYVLPVVAVIALPAGVALVASLLFRSARLAPLRPMLVAVVCGAFLLSMRAGWAWTAGYTAQMQSDLPVVQFIRQLPPDVLIAGWPQRGPRGGIINDVPYLTGRRAFLTFETHQVFHAAYAREMRRRMRALIDAYFAVDLQPLLRLRDEFGVTHLMIYTHHYLPDAGPPTYFEPFTETIRQRWQAAQAATLVALKLREEQPAVYRDTAFIVLDLRMLTPERRADQNVHITPK
jgi:hypothetical protein